MGRRAAPRVCERGAAAETMKRKHTGSGQRPPRIDWGVRATAQDEPPRERCYIHPDRAGRVAWDILLVVLLAYVAVAVPLNVCFQQEVSVDSAQFWIDMVVDVAFVADIVLHFFTGVWDSHRAGVLETDRAQIARKYLRGWFCIDVLAVLPYSYLVMLVEDSSASGASMRPPESNAMVKVLRLSKLTKLLRLTRMMQLVRRLDYKFNSSNWTTNLLSYFQLISCVIVVAYITHLVGCIWYAVGLHNFSHHPTECADYVVPGAPTNTSLEAAAAAGELRYEEAAAASAAAACVTHGWVEGQGWGPGTPTYTKWLTSFYWSVTTLTTVGYGDIAASTNAEKMYAVFAELIGTIVFGFLVGTVGQIIGSATILESRHRE
jgi:potassium voltage-gated channel Eag-related subfamily H protein 1